MGQGERGRDGGGTKKREGELMLVMLWILVMVNL